MAFTSPVYYFFLALVVLVHFALPVRWRPLCLLVASYLFYVSFRSKYIFFLLATTNVSFGAAKIMARSSSERLRKCTLAIALGFELIVLGLTKYWNPIALGTGWFGVMNILVPLGISFYTFQAIGYLIDVYRRTIEPETRLVHHALFLGFFPHLLAGPIEPAAHFLPQVQASPPFDRKQAAFGVQKIMMGLFKKFVIADALAPLVTLVFDDPASHAGGAAALAVVLARWRIYADFSGYTDIALGSAAVLGYKLNPNFRRPFFSDSISEYWRRWHISLGNWIRSYIFYPLVVSPISRFGVPGMVMVTFLVLGLWHGCTINFILYGLWQGVFLSLDLETKRLRERFYFATGLSRHPRLLKVVCILVTFFLIVVPPTLFFQSVTFATSRAMLSAIFQHRWGWSDFQFFSYSRVLSWNLYTCAVAICVLELFDWFQEKYGVMELVWRRSKALYWSALAGCALVILEFGHFAVDPSFIYLKF